jgi:kynureninase
MFTKEDLTIGAAQAFDTEDDIAKFRGKFNIPKDKDGKELLYFTGHSLGLMPKQTRDYLDHELNAWGNLGVEGHFKGKYPWMPYHEFLTEKMATIVGGKNSEVVVMNSLTVNLHLMLTSFYRPTKKRFKILIENNTFPSDKYAVDSQAKFHGYDPKKAVIQFSPKSHDMVVNYEEIEETIINNKDELALIMLGNVNYLSGQRFDFEKIVKLAHKHDIMIGFNLAHGAGNIELKLHEWNVDFAVWCSYKYLNSGPGGIAGCFVHENHGFDSDIPRFEGWWGHKKETRFKMPSEFEPIGGAETWQLSNPPIFQLASLRSSLDLFTEAGIQNLHKKSRHLTSYFKFLINEKCSDRFKVMTPEDCGAMICINTGDHGKQLVEDFMVKGVIADFREPNILRAAPIPMYNSYEDVYRFVEIMEKH